jgi:integrase
MRRARGLPLFDKTFATVIRAYRDSDKFKSLARTTQISYSYAFRAADDPNPNSLGSQPIGEMRPALMQAFLDEFADHPATQRNAKGAFAALEKWALVRELLPQAITTGTEVSNAHESYEPWSDEHIRIVATGQRGSDLVRMKWTDLETNEGVEGIRVVTQKTGRSLWIALPENVLAWPRSLGFIAPRYDGMPFTRPQLSSAWEHERKTNPQLAPHKKLGLSFHGLRASKVIALRLQNIEPTLIANVVGMSVQMVERYSQKANQIAAALKVRQRQGTGAEQNNVVSLPKRPLST